MIGTLVGVEPQGILFTVLGILGSLQGYCDCSPVEVPLEREDDASHLE